MQTCVLLSVKPEFAEAILNGRKTFEFRKVVYKNPSINTVVIYSSSPVQKVVGEFRVSEVLTMKPNELWRITKNGSGIDKKYFHRYFLGKDRAHALKVALVKRYELPLDLWKDFGIRIPPQSFCYLNNTRKQREAAA